MKTDNGLEPVESVPRPAPAKGRARSDGILIQDVRGPTITNADFHAGALRIASALSHLGVQSGECVVTMVDPRIEAHLCWIGINWAGAMEVPVNPEFRGTSLTYGISDSRARVLITSNAYLEKVRDARPELPHVEHLLTLDETVPEGFGDVRTLASLMAEAPARSFPAPQLTDPYAVIYTSGTTGPSKGVVAPWGSIQYAMIDQLFKGDRAEDYEDPAFYSPWPTFHSSGRTGLIFAATYDGRFVIRERLSVTAFWDDVRRFNCSHSHLLGIANFLFVQPERPDDADNPLKRVLMNPVLAGISRVPGALRRYHLHGLGHDGDRLSPPPAATCPMRAHAGPCLPSTRRGSSMTRGRTCRRARSASSSSSRAAPGCCSANI